MNFGVYKSLVSFVKVTCQHMLIQVSQLTVILKIRKFKSKDACMMQKKTSFTHALIWVPHILDFLVDKMPSVLPFLESASFDGNIFLHHIFFENLVKLVLKHTNEHVTIPYEP